MGYDICVVKNNYNWHERTKVYIMKKLTFFLCLFILTTAFANQEIVYPSSGEIKTVDSWDAYVSMTFLYWQAREEGVDLGVIGSSTIVPMDYSFCPAFKVKIGKSFSHDNWEFYGQYTRYYSKDKKAAVAPEGSSLVLNGDLDAVLFKEASNYWQLKFNVMDLRLQRLCYLGEKLVLAPVMALKACWINQHYNAIGVVDDNEIICNSYISSWGIGPSAGVLMNWTLGKGFYLFDTLYLGALYQKFRTSWSELDAYASLQKSMLNLNFETEAGIGWGTYCNNERWHYDVYFSYNFLAFSEQNMMKYLMVWYLSRDMIQPVISNLYLQGLNLSMRFDF